MPLNARLSIVLAIVASLNLQCVGAPTPPPPSTTTPIPSTATSLPPTPASTPFPPYSTVQLVWFYKPPTDGNLESLIGNFDLFVLTHYDEAVRDELKRKGVMAPFLQYLRFDAIHDPGSCDEEPWGNQVAYRTGDFCMISEQHPDWFMLDREGNRIEGDTWGEKFVVMDPGNKGWQEFWLTRAMQMQAQFGWEGIFADNIEASLSKRLRGGALPANYGTDAEYQRAVESLLQYVTSNYSGPFYANIIAVEDDKVWLRYLQYMDGAMIENFAADWGDEFFSAEDWEQELSLVEHAQSAGKHLILVSQGQQADLPREEFSLASYLLVNNGGAFFRYASSDYYEDIWIYDNYRLDLGEPLGPRYSDGVLWRRDFTNGTVTVDPEGHTAEITTR